ncbi:class I SAM-dependent methyltransferase [Thalassobaculum sp.]|uniref:class I SAM-dependent methyltransferase n=1 Tax=Thalassobaculum sp. TaxID=2022740 RepID=UPI0032ED3075
MDWIDGIIGEATVSPFEAVLLVVMLAGTLLIVFYAIRTGVPPQSSGRAARQAVLHLLPDEIEGPIVDLGSGWGALVEDLAARYPDNRVVGYELSPIPYWISLLRLRLKPRPNAEYRRADFLKADLSAFHAATCYLMIGAMKPLATKLNELPDGAVIVSNAFSLHGWTPEETITLSSTGATMYFRYIVRRDTVA